MDRTARERGLAGLTQVGTWTLQDSADYEAAHDLINAVIAAYSALLNTANEEDHPRILAQQRRHVEERRALTVTDRTEIRRIRDEYPALLQRLRSDA